MKSISASIIVLAAAVLIVGGSQAKGSGVVDLLVFVGFGVGLMGLGGWRWFVSLKEK